MNPLRTYADAWAESADRVVGLCASMSTDDWSLPTGCPGWSVRDVVAHLSALETALTGTGLGAPTLESDSGSIVTQDYTEAGVRMRDHLADDELLAELQEAVAARGEHLVELPDDPAGTAAVTPGGVVWDNQTLMRNRVVDIWAHEQDLRRALDRPGGFDGVAAQVVSMTFAAAMPYVLGKKVRATPGTSVVWEVTGPIPVTVAAEVGEDGRARQIDAAPDAPSATLRFDSETFTMLAAGRTAEEPLAIELMGDLAVAGAVLAQMAVTP